MNDPLEELSRTTCPCEDEQLTDKAKTTASEKYVISCFDFILMVSDGLALRQIRHSYRTERDRTFKR